jgi:hypothetical protein
MAELTDAQKLSEKDLQVEALEKALKAKDKELVNAAEIVADLKSQLADQAAGIVKLPTVSVGKDSYELVSGAFMWAGKEVTIDILKEDSKLTAELLKAGVANLRKVEATA